MKHKFYAQDNGKYIGLYLDRACKKLWAVFYRDRSYFDQCYFGKRIVCEPGLGPKRVEWVNN